MYDRKTFYPSKSFSLREELGLVEGAILHLHHFSSCKVEEGPFTSHVINSGDDDKIPGGIDDKGQQWMDKMDDAMAVSSFLVFASPSSSFLHARLTSYSFFILFRAASATDRRMDPFNQFQILKYSAKTELKLTSHLLTREERTD